MHITVIITAVGSGYCCRRCRCCYRYCSYYCCCFFVIDVILL